MMRTAAGGAAMLSTTTTKLRTPLRIISGTKFRRRLRRRLN